MRPPRLPFRRPRRPPQSPPFPYTTLFRSAQALARLLVGDQGHVAPGLFDRRDLQRAGGASLEVGLQPAILLGRQRAGEVVRKQFAQVFTAHGAIHGDTSPADPAAAKSPW